MHGALQTNAVSLVSAAGRGCYATVSLLSHSCVPNLEPAADPGRVMRLRAKRRISRGEQLTMRSEQTKNLQKTHLVKRRLSFLLLG